MTLRHVPETALRHAWGAPLVACAALVACSNGPPPAPEAFANLTQGPHLDSLHQNWCSSGTATQVLLVGADLVGKPTTQANMSQQSDGRVDVNCTVTGGFDVSLTTRLEGTLGGTLEISGHVGLSGGSNITAAFSTTGDQFSQSDCTIAFTYQGARVPATPPVAGGRIWGHLSCPSAVNSARQLRIPSNPAPVDETCDLEADFEFINCS